MNLFKTTTWTWWQMGLLKWSVFLIGLAAGAYWNNIFLPYAGWCFVVGLIPALYLTYVWFKQ